MIPYVATGKYHIYYKGQEVIYNNLYNKSMGT
jgi:hypothetical protein